MIKEISTEEYVSSYSFHKKNYWKRKLNKKFDYELLTGIKEDKLLKQNLFKKNIDNINLETSTYCNRKCGYCPVSTYGRNFKLFMDLKLFKNIINSLKIINYNHSFCLNLYNEPLADQNFGFYIRFIRENLPLSVIQTNSNGDYIKNLNDLYLLEEFGLNKIKITMHVPKNKSYSKADAELSIYKFAKKINFNLNKKNISELCFNFRINKLFVHVQSPNFFIEGTDRGGSINTTKISKNRISPCVKPFREFTIYHDGTVTPCCDIFNNINFNKYSISKINANDLNSIFNIYASQKLSEWRLHTFGWNLKENVCKTCSSYDKAYIGDAKKRKKILDELANSKINLNYK